MANTYSKIYLQIVFAVKNRDALLRKPWRNDVFAYMAAALNKRGNYSLAVNGSFDHVHLFFDYKGKELIRDLVREIKKSSNTFIKDRKLTRFKFQWQSGYGVFSHSNREKGTIIQYIMKQEEHHQKVKFNEEYFKFLKDFEVEFKEEYVFDFLE